MAYRIKSSLQVVRGYYHVRGRVYDEETGKVSQFGRSTGLPEKNNKRRAEVKQKEIEVAILQELVNLPENREPLLGEYIMEWLAKKEQSNSIGRQTLICYRQYATGHIVPAIGAIEVRCITHRTIQAYYSEKQKELKASSLRRHHNVIMGVLDEAVSDGLLQYNPCRVAKIVFPRGEKTPGKAYTEEQLSILFAGAEKAGEPIRSAVILMACYGLRREEMLGLRWKDIDFESGQIHICNTVTNAGAEIVEAERTKTAGSKRDITLIACTVPYLKDLQAQQKKHFALDKVVRWDNGRSVRPDYITKAVPKLMDECGLPHIRLYDLRHTAISLLSKVASPKQVQEFAGHSNISTTMNIYAHGYRSERDDSARKMNGLLENAGFCSAFCSASENTD